MQDYSDFLSTKTVDDVPTGLDSVPGLNPMLFPFQRDIVRWSLMRGRSAVFADCGLGKTPMQLEWAKHVPGKVLILAPLAVSQQTVREGVKFGVDVSYARSQDAVKGKITITNYEMLSHFDVSQFDGVVIDESGILKAYDGKTRTQIIESFASTPFRLACTATPAPNDYMELGNHAEFLGVMNRTEMLSMFFVHDGGETQKWRLKGHAEAEFWRWVCSWAVMMRMPSDLGYEDGDFVLPPLATHQITVKADSPSDGFLFPMVAETLQERIAARRSSVEERCKAAAALVNDSDDYWLVWCNLNSESERLKRLINGAVEVKGSDSTEHKETSLEGFAAGKIRVLVSKPSIAGWGMNFQHCKNVAFVGLSDSWEQYYQATRRCWRFGQKRPVDVYLVTSELEGAVVANIARKEKDAAAMAENMVMNMSDLNRKNIVGTEREKAVYARDVHEGRGYTLHLGDCVDVAREMADDSVDYSIFSPPFASLYTYSNSDRDMGNVKDLAEFLRHYRYLVREQLRITKPGRLLSAHCMDLPTSKTHHGYIGLQDFRGTMIRMYQRAGWIYHSTVVIWKDPVTAMQRTKALGLLHKQLKKDSCMSRQGIPDYVVTFRKPGENPDRVEHTNEDYPVSRWQRIASPIWTDINPSDTLQFRSAREDKDEKHICPLQLEVVRRCLELWTREGDLVMSPFAGIGTEGYVSLEMGREFVGAELKESYFKQAIANMEEARKPMLF